MPDRSPARTHTGRTRRSLRRGALMAVVAGVIGMLALADLAAAAPVPASATPAAPIAAAPVAAASTATASTAGAAAAPARVGVSVVRSGNGSVRLVATTPTGTYRLLHNRPGSPFQPAIDLGGPVLGTPAVAHDDATGRYDVFVVGADHRLRVRSRVGNVWRPWTLVGTTSFVSGPDVVRSRDGDLHVVAVGADHRVREVVIRRGAVVATRLVGGQAKGSPAITYSAGQKYVVFWTGADGRIWRSVRTSGAWSKPAAISTVTGFTGGVGATLSAGGYYWVVATRTNNHVYVLRTTARGWTGPTSVGGARHGKPDVTAGPSPSQIDVWAVGTDGRMKRRTYAGGTWRGWDTVTGSGYGTAAPTLSPAKQLMKRWGTSLGGTSTAKADLEAAAAGRSIVGPCGTSTKIDPKLITLLLAATDRYDVTLNNLVRGRSCDSGQHPRGAAIDFWTVHDPRTGRTTNFDSGLPGDSPSLDREFVEFLAARLPARAGIGQRYCAGQSSARIPAGILFFADTCNHQHVQLYTR